MLLKDMHPGQKGQIVGTHKGHYAERRLFELGFVPGAKVEMLSKHPFKGPLVVKLGNAQIAVGRGVAAAVEVVLDQVFAGNFGPDPAD